MEVSNSTDVIVVALLKFAEMELLVGKRKSAFLFPQYLTKARLAGALAVALKLIYSLQTWIIRAKISNPVKSINGRKFHHVRTWETKVFSDGRNNFQLGA